MAFRRWQPDTHAADLLVDFDADPPVCSHAWLDGVEQADAQACFDQVWAQNKAKNIAIAAAISVLPERMLKPVLDSDGNPTGDLVPLDAFDPAWRMDETGAVTISVPGADADLTAEIHEAVAGAVDGAQAVPHEG
jgi:hypothetical protein